MLLLIELVINSMTLPQRCSYIHNGRDCLFSPSFIISIESNNDEYMIGVVCQDHRDRMEDRIKAMQRKNTVPQGKAKFQEIRTVATDCVSGTNIE